MSIRGTYTNKVDECVTDARDKLVNISREELGIYVLAVVREVDPEIHEVVSSKTGFIDYLFQRHLIELVGDIPQHNLESVSYCACLC